MKYDIDYLCRLCVHYLDNDEQIPIDIVFECVTMGIDVSKFFNWAYRCNDEIERMKKVLSKLDCKISQYESWYSVIYRERG